MKFEMFATSVTGKKYFERGLRCQDSAGALTVGSVQAIALADGHGGKDYFLSDVGSRLAVTTAFEQIKIFCSGLEAEERFAENGIKNFEFSLRNEWRKTIQADWDARRASGFEALARWQEVSDKYKARYTSDDAETLARYVPVAYGTTLLCAVSIGSQVLLTQIGDGSCVVLQRDGEFKTPVPPDADNFANVTTSLCDADAYKKFRHVVLNCAEDLPQAPLAIFLSSDGLDDCYPIHDNAQYLFKLYGDALLDGMIRNGLAATQEAVRAELLPYMTEHGSHDDISLAWLVTEDLNSIRRALNRANHSELLDTFASLRSNVERLVQKKIADAQPQVALQAAQAREKFLPDWWAERTENHD